jgi:dynactin 1
MLQASQQVDTATTSKEAQNIMNLNLKLQSTAAKMQNKAIDVELQKLEAAQLSEHLRIVQVSCQHPEKGPS